MKRTTRLFWLGGLVTVLVILGLLVNVMAAVLGLMSASPLWVHIAVAAGVDLVVVVLAIAIPRGSQN